MTARSEPGTRTSPRFSPERLAWAALALFFLADHGARIAHRVHETPPSPLSDLLFYLGWAYALSLWVDTDRKRLRIPATFDFGLYF